MNWQQYQTACQALRTVINNLSHRIAVEHSKLQPDTEALLRDQQEKNVCCDRLYALTPFMDDEIAAIIRDYAHLADVSESPPTDDAPPRIERRTGHDRRSGGSDRRSGASRPNWTTAEQA